MESTHAECGSCDAAVPSKDRNGSFDLIVSDLVPIIDRVEASIRSIEAVTVQDCAGNQEFAEVVMLDDVTRLRTQASAALGACNASLSAALRFLLATKSPPAHAEVV